LGRSVKNLALAGVVACQLADPGSFTIDEASFLHIAQSDAGRVYTASGSEAKMEILVVSLREFSASLLNWYDSQTYWLNVTNVALGIVIAICVAVVLGGIAHEFASRIRKRRRIEAEIDRDMVQLADDHTCHVPGLGVTMADGGEKLRQPDPPNQH